MQIKDYLKNKNIVSDGSFGTYYTNKYDTSEFPERANIDHPERVAQIHRDYLEAGASLIRTNTFESNTVSLGVPFDQVEENIRAAAHAAKKAVYDYKKSAGAKDERDIFVAGDIGPIEKSMMFRDKEAEEEYYRIAKVFIDCGIRIINFETFASLNNIKGVIRRLKEEEDVFIMVSFSVNQLGYSLAGRSAKNLFSEAGRQDGIDAVGLNCGIGPSHMYDILEKADLPDDKFIIAVPNAGYPVLSRNLAAFGGHPAYFADKIDQLMGLGVSITGGCCGTVPGFIERINDVEGVLDKRDRKPKSVIADSKVKSISNSFMVDEYGKKKEHKLIAVELAPPFDADDEKLLESAHLLESIGVDTVTFPDSPSGRTRVDSVLMADKVQRETGLKVMPHICCRDKNALAMRSLFMGAKINGVDNFLVITGDPVPSTARDSVKQVFNFGSIGLMEIIKEMNEEQFSDSLITYGGAINQNRKNIQSVIDVTKKKMEAGASFFLTQPIFSREQAYKVKAIKEETGATILCGVMPLISRRNAIFMKNEISGIEVTDEVISRYPEGISKEEGERIGIQLGREVISYVEDFADGYYFSFPFNRVRMLTEILDGYK